MWRSYKYLSYERDRRLKQKRKKGEFFCGSSVPFSGSKRCSCLEQQSARSSILRATESAPADPQNTHKRTRGVFSSCKLSEGPRVRNEIPFCRGFAFSCPRVLRILPLPQGSGRKLREREGTGFIILTCTT